MGAGASIEGDEPVDKEKAKSLARDEWVKLEAEFDAEASEAGVVSAERCRELLSTFPKPLAEHNFPQEEIDEFQETFLLFDKTGDGNVPTKDIITVGTLSSHCRHNMLDARR
jgi:hypothetical protein